MEKSEKSWENGHHSIFTHEEMIELHAKHALINTDGFRSKEEYVLHLIHAFAYYKAAQLAKNKRVLDLGCNTGYGTEIIFKISKNVVGVDVSDKAILAAKSRYGYLGIEFQVIDGRTLPFPEGAFDVVTSFQVIEHIVDYSLFINGIRKVLAPNGLAVFTTPNSLLRLDPGMRPWNKFHVREFDYIELKSLLKDFFRHVSIFGLFANEPLYSIEANRLERARENAKNGQPVRLSINDYIKIMLPQKAMDVLGITRRAISLKAKSEFKAFMQKYGLSELSYRQNDLESALDLMAICSNDDKVFGRIKL